MPRKISKKGLKTKADKLWSLAVKLRAGMKCERCHKTDTLNSHHVISRKFNSLRHDLDNGVCICASCHFWAHQNPIESSLWFLSKRGEEWHTQLVFRKNKIIKNDVEESIDYLNKYIAEKGG